MILKLLSCKCSTICDKKLNNNNCSDGMCVICDMTKKMQIVASIANRMHKWSCPLSTIWTFVRLFLLLIFMSSLSIEKQLFYLTASKSDLPTWNGSTESEFGTGLCNFILKYDNLHARTTISMLRMSQDISLSSFLDSELSQLFHIASSLDGKHWSINHQLLDCCPARVLNLWWA